MDILRGAVAGTLESSDAYVRIAPGDGQGITLDIESVVLAQYGPAPPRCLLHPLAPRGAAPCRGGVQAGGRGDGVLQPGGAAAARRAAAPREEGTP